MNYDMNFDTNFWRDSGLAENFPFRVLELFNSKKRNQFMEVLYFSEREDMALHLENQSSLNLSSFPKPGFGPFHNQDLVMN